jgi:hypothetical protein
MSRSEYTNKSSILRFQWSVIVDGRRSGLAPPAPRAGISGGTRKTTRPAPFDRAREEMKGLAARRRCVFTTIFGRYETLQPQPGREKSSIPFICLTDDPNLTSDTWEVRVVTPRFGMDPIRSQRDAKLRPYLYLEDIEHSLYVDNRVELLVPPEEVFESYGNGPFWVPLHSFRETLADEFLEVVRLGRDDPSRVFEQMNHYALEFPELLDERPFWTGILLREHADPDVRRTMETWASHVQRYSRRDQLSANYAFRHEGLEPAAGDIDNLSSWFHRWPRDVGRVETQVHDPAVSLSPLVARLRRQERNSADLARTNAVLTDQLRAERIARQGLELSPGGRIGALANRIGAKYPRLLRPLWRAARAVWRAGR